MALSSLSSRNKTLTDLAMLPNILNAGFCLNQELWANNQIFLFHFEACPCLYLETLLFFYRGIFFHPLALCCNLQMFSSQSARLSERRGEEPFAYESLFGRDGCQSIWAEMEKSSSCPKQSPLLLLPSRQTVPCRASGGERGGKSKKRNKHFKLNPQTKDGGGGRVKWNEGRERKQR